MSVVKMFYDVETTGLNHKKSSIIQLAGIIEVDGIEKEKFSFNIKPHPKATIEPEALSTNKKTVEEIMAYPDMKDVYKTFMKMLLKYTDRYDKNDKVYLVGFNNRKFDDLFLHKFFELCDDRYFFGIFYTETIDVICLAAQYLIHRRKYMPSFKLRRVALELGFNVLDEDLHDAIYDVLLTRDIYKVLVNEAQEPAQKYRYYWHPESDCVFKSFEPSTDIQVDEIDFIKYKDLLKEYGLHDGPQMIQDELF